MEDIIELKGSHEGPTSMVLVGVHGNETCGVEALERVLPDLRVIAGTVLIGYGNPRAMREGVRSTEANLNRMFKPDAMLTDAEKASYEYQRAQFLKPYLDRADVLLDIHASFTPKSRRFLICEPNAAPVADLLPFDTIVSGFDTVQPGGTDYYMNAKGGVGICAECGFLGDSSSADIAEETLVAFLRARGHIPGEMPRRNQSHIRMYELYYAKTNRFVLAKAFDDFEELSAGTVIGTDGEEEVRAKKDSIILFALDTHARGEECFLLGAHEKSLTG